MTVRSQFLSSKGDSNGWVVCLRYGKEDFRGLRGRSDPRRGRNGKFAVFWPFLRFCEHYFMGKIFQLEFVYHVIARVIAHLLPCGGRRTDLWLQRNSRNGVIFGPQVGVNFLGFMVTALRVRAPRAT